ncbi:hypothetical protein LJC16_03785 [Bacteroidales bacterium OttesenSCG-928-C19]|nr:hypothetical protein [Bacteroidales bacterium OttesenSCG-928-C19]
MIKSNIAREYPSHIAKANYSDQTLYLADYTKQTNNALGVEVFESTPPSDIDTFELKNSVNLPNGYISFDNHSFTRPDGSPLSQCECVVFPDMSDIDSWIFFVELKYSNRPYNNNNNITKAIKQLYKTRTYYLNKCVFAKTNPCYLLASLPMQAEPFAQTVISPMDLQKLKKKHNVILRLQNHAEIQNDKKINV